MQYLLHNSLLIIVAQRAAKFVVIHGWTVLLHPPESCNLEYQNKTIKTIRAGKDCTAVPKSEHKRSLVTVQQLNYEKEGRVPTK